ncbi:hypothetical protein [Celerinatantimonas diazotrophica]|uniref:Uncharacterized protein n=1 Tax=Celerinatantimonas diazotrophica TaxID=412034 RepID=A0A4R1KEY4_9GAMM|nr:hypothetical protein [Celerinatantimonas diazotrophica]TCK63288.1 hypothetical protein EV690_0173 [Celerinatantimonas diazotrophica]CAG9298432.1 hypothetical protein CEDIAZO_03637 [Celerinatantimonas diazotrophica]
MEETKKYYRCYATGQGFFVRIPVKAPDEQPEEPEPQQAKA